MGNSIKSMAIVSFAKFIIGGSIFTKIKHIVINYNDANLSGEEKRKQALKDIADIGIQLSSWAINLGIELAVAWAKNQSK